MRVRAVSQRRTTVTIDGTAMEIWVAQAGQSTWRAKGFFNSTHVETTGPTAIEAAAAWKTQALAVTRPPLER